jgi:hypothetical protein
MWARGLFGGSGGAGRWPGAGVAIVTSAAGRQAPRQARPAGHHANRLTKENTATLTWVRGVIDVLRQDLQGPDVRGPRSLVATGRRVLDALVVLRASVAVDLNRRVTDEYTWRRIVGRYEAEALVRVEPFQRFPESLKKRASSGLRDRLSLPVKDGARRSPAQIESRT